MNRPDIFGFAMDFLGEPEASELLAYIQELEKARGEWVSVDDRLPLPSDKILMCTNNGNVFSGRGTPLRAKLKARDSGEGFVSDYYTHWQPLPTPPTE